MTDTNDRMTLCAVCVCFGERDDERSSHTLYDTILLHHLAIGIHIYHSKLRYVHTYLRYAQACGWSSTLCQQQIVERL